jgi:glycosyltransferase involved in cell wall biosynthesis
MANFGIAIVTYNRVSRLRETIEHLRNKTSSSVQLIVSDDGSTDGTLDFLKGENIPHIVGQNRGVCWNKNRGLFFLANMIGCDAVILIEDDTRPNKEGWETDWFEAAQDWGHVNFAGPWFAERFESGAGSVSDPVLCPVISGQCCAYSREALAFVGYLDPRFKGYGHGHAEHSKRLIRAGYGGSYQSGRPQFRLLKSDLHVEAAESFKNPEDLARNATLAKELANEPLYRSPWANDAEMEIFRTEMKSALSTFK